MANELIPADQTTAMQAVDTIAREYGLAASENLGQIERTLMIATGTEKMKAMLTDKVMAPIMALQGSTLGFRTDKDASGGYPMAVVRDVTCEALMRGFRAVGNEFNIIAGRFYAAKDGCKRRVIEWPNLTEFNLELSFPTDKGGTSYVDAIATWKLNGVENVLERRGKTAIPIRRNSGMLDDAILGKAERKMYAAVLNRLSTFVIPEGEVDADAIDVTSRPVGGVKRSSLNDYAEAEAEPDIPKPSIDPEEQIGFLDSFRSKLEMTREANGIAEVQKEAASLARSGKLSAETLRHVNDLANQRRKAIRNNSDKLFAN
jgi:hypothetical protein